jgi:hypothetical protein
MGGRGSAHPARWAAVTHVRRPGFDVYIDGIPFLLAISTQVPFADKSAPWRKEQFDSAPEPGEQTLSDFWTRSQLSFHGGAGQSFLDTNAGRAG